MIRGALAASLSGVLALLSGCMSTHKQPVASAYYDDADDTCGDDITVEQSPWTVSDSDCRKAH